MRIAVPIAMVSEKAEYEARIENYEQTVLSMLKLNTVALAWKSCPSSARPVKINRKHADTCPYKIREHAGIVVHVKGINHQAYPSTDVQQLIR